MSVNPNVGRGRSIVAGALGTVASGALLTALLHWGVPSPGDARLPRPEAALTALLAWIAVALSAWLGVGCALAAASALPGVAGAGARRASRWVTPRVLRQALAITLGSGVATLTLPVSSTAVAATCDTASSPGHPGGGRDLAAPPDPSFSPTPALGPTRLAGITPLDDEIGPRHTVPPAPDPGWRPSAPPRRPHASESRLLAPSPRARQAVDARVTVRRGDTLWSIAARHLGPGAGDAEISLAWPRWYAANRDLIGADPDVLVPGQQLRPPAQGDPR